MGVSLVAWNRYGHKRTYVNEDDGTSLGYRDEKTGEIHVTVEARADEVHRALAAGPAEPAAPPVSPLPAVPETRPAPAPANAVSAGASPAAVARSAAVARRGVRRAWSAPNLTEKALADELVRASPFLWEREVAMGPYRLDFYCARALLAVEVDGSSHRNRAGRDAERDAYFLRHGIETMRVEAGRVEHDCAAVVAEVNRRCIARTGSVPEVAAPARGLLGRLLGRTERVAPPPLAPPDYEVQPGRRSFVCARCRAERSPVLRSTRSPNCCTACAG